MNKLNKQLKAHNGLTASKMYYHGSSNSVVKALAEGDMDVNQVLHVTDDPLVAAEYAGAKGSVMAVAVNQEYGVQSRISLCKKASVNGANQWVMGADEANEMLNAAEAVLAVPVWAVRKVMTA